MTERGAWWQEARLGMFIHWGLYALPAGLWQGQECPCIGEWIMSYFRLPVAEYARLAEQFNPVRFDAEEWVAIAQAAGMKYLVITAKHHDGFAMYHSTANPYNIVDATPFHRDPLRELATACAKAGIRFCVYYSQALDWHEEDAGGTEPGLSKNVRVMSWGNDWDFPDHSRKVFSRYLEAKVKPQLRELLTGYGPLGLIWFDCPFTITPEQSREIADFVHELQPDCLVSGRIGHDAGDYGSLGDNQSPGEGLAGNWEVIATMNDTWGFKASDHNWKSAEDLLTILVDNCSKGANLLLNVGPTAEGLLPEPSVERLRAMGAWLRYNGEALYGRRPSPYPYDFEWGRITRGPSRLYLHLLQWPEGEFVLYGLRNPVRGATLLVDPGRQIEVEQSYDVALDLHVLRLRLPGARPEEPISVVRLELAGEVDVDPTLTQAPSGAISLPASAARLHVPPGETPPTVDPGGAFRDWCSTAPRAEWEVKVAEPGEYAVDLVLRSIEWGAEIPDGHEVTVSLGGATVTGTARGEAPEASLRTHCYPEILARVGSLVVPAPGVYQVGLQAESLNPAARYGLTVAAVRMSRER